MDDYLNDFVNEGKERITELNNSLLELENNPSSQEAMENIFRTAHTLKGNFAAMGFKDASDLAHAVEDLLDEIRQGEMDVTPEIMDAIFDGVDLLETILDEIAEDGEYDTDPTPVVREIRGALEGGDEIGTDEAEEEGEADGPGLGDAVQEAIAELDPDLGDDARAFHVEIDMADAEMKGVDAMFVLGAVEEEVDVLATVPDRGDVTDGDYGDSFELFVTTERSGEDLRELLDSIGKAGPATVTDVTARLAAGGGDDDASEPVEPGVTGGEEGSREERSPGREESTEPSSTEEDESPGEERSVDKIQSIRVGVDQLDVLMNRVEELVTTRIKLRQAIFDGDQGEAEEELGELDKIASGLQDTVMDMRLVPIKKVVGKFPRMVRDIARAEGKKVDFEIEGEDIEIDRTVLNEIGDPLMHLIRNAVDHGVEPPEEREAAGKPETGQVRLVCRRERDKVTIELSDDGSGIDADALRDKAVSEGALSREEADALPDEETYHLIFESGLSTSGEVTDVSGRGVGMDVVKNTITSLDGSIDIESEPGEGTSITLTLPVTVAIVKILLVSSGDETYGLPLKYVEEITRTAERKTVEGEEVVMHDEKVYPIIELAEALDVPDADGDGEMLVRIVDTLRQSAISCDNVLGQEEVVVKPFEGILSGIPGVSGAAILGQGDVVPILDIETL